MRLVVRPHEVPRYQARNNRRQFLRLKLPGGAEPEALYFEKLLALDERLWVGVDYRGLK